MYHMLDLLSWDGTPFSDLVCGTFIIATLCATVFFTKSRDDRERLLKARRRSDSVEGLVELHNDRVLNACAELFAGFDDRTPSSASSVLHAYSMPVLPEADMEDLLPTPLTREVCRAEGKEDTDLNEVLTPCEEGYGLPRPVRPSVLQARSASSPEVLSRHTAAAEPTNESGVFFGATPHAPVLLEAYREGALPLSCAMASLPLCVVSSNDAKGEELTEDLRPVETDGSESISDDGLTATGADCGGYEEGKEGEEGEEAEKECESPMSVRACVDHPYPLNLLQDDDSNVRTCGMLKSVSCPDTVLHCKLASSVYRCTDVEAVHDR